MDHKPAETESDLHIQILEFCRHLAGSAKIAGICLFDYCTTETKWAKGMLQIILVIRDFPTRIMSHVRVIRGRTLLVLVVDEWVFERDIDRGFLGEASAGLLVFPYVALSGKEYLHTEEIMLKKRLILELMGNLTLSFPELSERILIKPDYFMYEVLMTRVRVFPPLARCVSKFMQETEPGTKPNPTLEGYKAALKELEREEKLTFSGDFVMISKKLVSEGKKPKAWLASISRNAPRSLFTPIFEVFPQILNLFSLNIETPLRIQALEKWNKFLSYTQPFVDPQKYILIATANGLVSLADRVEIEEVVRRKLMKNRNCKTKVETIGGVLNDVSLIKAFCEGEEKSFLVKRFRDWSGFKWFPLNLWSLGTRTFAVLGKSRLERECVVSELLRSEGFDVPKILHVSHRKRLVFMEYIEGENLSNIVKRIVASAKRDANATELQFLTRVGEMLARVHSVGITLGDTKPENVIVTAEGRIFLLDFEQSSTGGDKSWDIAEFLYYSGHYLPPVQNADAASSIAKAFINGYLNAGGNVNAVRKAGATKYTRVFSLFTAPAVLLAMASICRKADVAK